MRYKYPRTPHLPWSPGADADDIVSSSLSCFLNQEIVVTEKMDGENTSIYRDGLHARSLDSAYHPSRSAVKTLQAILGPQIPEGWRLCCENCYALHSIPYDALSGYVFLLSVWNDNNECLSWDETVEWAALLELPVPEVLYRGVFDQKKLLKLHERLDIKRQEGFVVRTTTGFAYKAFASHIAKWVRTNHVQSDEFWMSRPVVPNRLRSPT
jgi:hypothetical protein